MADDKLVTALQRIEQELGLHVDSFKRFSNGLCHEVYEIRTIDQECYVLRISPIENELFLMGGIELSKMFQHLLPIPGIIYASSAQDDVKFVVQNKIIGLDLSECYNQVSNLNKRQVAKSIIEIQRIVNRNMSTSKFGFGVTENDFEYDRWSDFLKNRLDSFHAIIPIKWHVAMSESLRDHNWFLKSRKSHVFIDDLSLKNIIIHDGYLAGIIDVDWLFSGDILFFVAKVYSECTMHGYDFSFPDALLAMVEADMPKSVLDFYINLYCFEILSWENIDSVNGNHLSEEVYRRVREYLKSFFG